MFPMLAGKFCAVVANKLLTRGPTFALLELKSDIILNLCYMIAITRFFDRSIPVTTNRKFVAFDTGDPTWVT